MKILAAVAFIVLLAVGIVLVNVRRTDPPQVANSKPGYATIYTYYTNSGKVDRLVEIGANAGPVQRVEAGSVGTTLLAFVGMDSPCVAKTAYKGGRITYEDGSTKECKNLTMEGFAGSPITHVRCESN